MKLKIGGLYQLNPSVEHTHPYRKESNRIIVYQVKNAHEKLLDSVEFISGTPVVVVSKVDNDKFVSCLIEDKVYEVNCQNLIKLS